MIIPLIFLIIGLIIGILVILLISMTIALKNNYEKSIKKKVKNKEGLIGDLKSGFCPTCGQGFCCYPDSKESIEFCYKCGQKLDWS